MRRGGLMANTDSESAGMTSIITSRKWRLRLFLDAFANPGGLKTRGAKLAGIFLLSLSFYTIHDGSLAAIGAQTCMRHVP